MNRRVIHRIFLGAAHNWRSRARDTLYTQVIIHMRVIEWAREYMRM